MEPALERTLTPRTKGPVRPDPVEADRRLNIAVIFTTVPTTLSAMRKAGSMAASLGARITLLVPQVVPYPLPLGSPPVLLDWNEKRFRVIASQSPVETVVRIFLCRDTRDAVEGSLGPKSLVVIGGRKTFWPFTKEKRLARRLGRCGHEVIFAEAE